MAVRSEKLSYEGPGGSFEGVVAWDPAHEGRRPGVLVGHTWMGQGEMEAERAAALAELGYVGFAVDVYGKGRRATTPEEAGRLMGELNQDRQALQGRMAAALATLRGLAVVDAKRTAAMGYCLGGKCVLDLARSGSDVNGVVSIHGVFDAPPFPNAETITAKVLVLHGWDDPLATPEQTVALAKELSASKADWQIHAYGGAMHAFTARGLNEPSKGLAYHANAARRSWQATLNFFEELFG
ncbi:dienelactone hydrolase family protein [Chondromyces crocatus]|uniref:Dienelactone hydrolase n=1 Tax=Chondromyces crocatus TaxID=52 RepID=A0A0K1EC11_CHOCO|nr:dienelactone hydrolase family protein [Chondromyces crocatus]AKT38394.1 dienelactone hydrolase [Chondromyces crocatus]